MCFFGQDSMLQVTHRVLFMTWLNVLNVCFDLSGRISKESGVPVSFPSLPSLLFFPLPHDTARKQPLRDYFET